MANNWKNLMQMYDLNQDVGIVKEELIWHTLEPLVDMFS